MARARSPQVLSHALAGRRPGYWTLWRTCEAAVLAHIPLEGPLLDIGVGDGFFGEHVYAKDIGVGIDLDRDALRCAQSRRHCTGVCCGDAHALPFQPGSFATVFSNCVLEHVEDIDIVLGEIARVLRGGGRLVCTVPPADWGRALRGVRLCHSLGWRTAAARYEGFLNTVFDLRNLLTVTQWRDRLAGAGLELIEARYYAAPPAVRRLEWLLWAGLPGHIVSRLTGLRPFLTAKWWTRRLAVGAYAEADGAGLCLVAQKRVA